MKLRIAVLGAMLFTIVSMGTQSLNASSMSQADLEKYFTIDSVEMVEVADDGHEFFPEAMPRPTLVPDKDKPGPKPPSTGGLGELGQIITLGERIWAIIEKNRPIITQQYATVSAVPAGTKHWEELEGWSDTVTRVFKVSYINKFKQNVAEFEYRVAYSYGGHVGGRGKFLSQVTIEPKLLNVMWGFKFNANGVVANVKNKGTKEAPVASMDLVMNYSVYSVMKHMQEGVRFQIDGDGLFTNRSDGTIAAGSFN